MSRKVLMAFLFAAVLFSLMPNAAQAQEGCETEAQCEAELFPYSAESEANWSFDMSVVANATEQQCLQAKAVCDGACNVQAGLELVVCSLRYGWSPMRLGLCYAAAMARHARCLDTCYWRAIDCIRNSSGGGSGPGNVFDRDAGDGGSDCGLSAEYAYSCYGP